VYSFRNVIYLPCLTHLRILNTTGVGLCNCYDLLSFEFFCLFCMYFRNGSSVWLENLKGRTTRKT
jgi:hypothetical protein